MSVAVVFWAVLALAVAFVAYRVLTFKRKAPMTIGKRADCTRDRFTKKKVPGEIDAIVIGSGMGGMEVAGLLAKTGRCVLVLEQHYIAGGCCHTFDDHGYEFDTGLHYIGDPDMTGPILNLATHRDKKVRFAKMGTTDGLCFDKLLVGPERQSLKTAFNCKANSWKEDLIKAFPKEEAAINKYHALARQAVQSAGPYFLMKVLPRWLSACLLPLVRGAWKKVAGRSAWDVVCELTDNKELRAILCAQFGDIGGPPDEIPFAMQAMIYTHYLEGGMYPIGGPEEFARSIIPVVEEAGGRVLVSAPVERILVEGGRAVGVHVKGTDVRAPIVISNASTMMTYSKLLPREVVEPLGVLPKLKALGTSVGHVYTFVGLKGSTEELQLPSANLWVLPCDKDYDLNQMTRRSYDNPLSPEKGEPLLFIGFPSAKDPDFQRRFPGKSTAVLLTEAKYEWFEKWSDKTQGRRGEDYEALKKRFEALLLKGLLKHFPHLEDKIDFVETATPLTNNYYLGASEGESYGLDCTIERMTSPKYDFLRPKGPIPGLYFTGQDVASHGVVGAMLSGVMTFAAVVGVPTVEWFTSPKFMLDLSTTFARIAVKEMLRRD